MSNWEHGLAVRCAGCRRAVAWSSKPAQIRNAIYCSEWCREEPPATPMEARNDMWHALYLSGIAPAAISRMYGVAHSLVYKTLRRVTPAG